MNPKKELLWSLWVIRSLHYIPDQVSKHLPHGAHAPGWLSWTPDRGELHGEGWRISLGLRAVDLRA